MCGCCVSLRVCFSLVVLCLVCGSSGFICFVLSMIG